MKEKLLIINGQHINLEKSGGAGQYCEQLYNKLLKTQKQGDVNFNIFFANFGKYPKKKFSFGEKIYKYFCKRNDKEDKGIDSILKSTKKILLHELTNYQSIKEIGRLKKMDSKILVTFLDIQDYYYPEYFSDRILSERVLNYSFYKENADLFFSISEFTKQSMVEKLNINPDKITVTHLAPKENIVIPEADIDFAKKFERYWIYPAKAWKHKNHAFLIKSIASIKELVKKNNIKLLLTGGFRENDIDYLNNIIYENNIHDFVKILGFVSNDQLHALIKCADFLLFPSLFEGFGLPILEAMSLGCPVISSNATSLPEVGGDAPLYFDPKNQQGLTELLIAAIKETGVDRNNMIEKGFENCKRFNWDKTCNKTIDTYKQFI